MSTAQRTLIEQNIFMSPIKADMIVNGLVPRAAKIPAGFEMLASVAVLSFNPAVKIERLNRMDHIAALISETLVSDGA